MTYSFGKSSLEKRDTLHPKLQRVVDEVIKYYNFSIIEGVRTKERQAELFAQGKSKTLDSKHLADPNGKSRAMDLCPFPIDWSDRERFILFAGYVLGTAQQLGIVLVWGGDWNRDFYTKDTGFFDEPHFQLADDEV